MVVALILVVLVGQTSAYVCLLNRILMNTDAGWRRTLAMLLAPLFLVGVPVVALIVLRDHPVLSDLAHLRASPGAVGLVVVYAAMVLVGVVRFLWVSLVTLPRRRRPPILASAIQSIRRYRPRRSGFGWRCAGPLLESIARLNCRFDLEVNEFVLQPPGLPGPFDGFSIVHLTDPHFLRSSPEGWTELLVATIDRLRPDLIAITGDFLASARDLARAERVLSPLRAPHGVWAVRGNHDFWEAPEGVRDMLGRVGIGLLANRRVEIRRSGEAIDLIGVEAPWDHAHDPWRDLLAGPTERTTIVLSHTPDNTPAAARLGAKLMLAGHTHGGQIRFPLVGSLVVPSRYGKRYDQGWFVVGQLVLYVNRGIGTYAPKLRVACRPEIARLVLRCGVGPLDNEARRT